MEEVITEKAVKSYTYHSPDQKFSVCGILDTKDGVTKMRIGIALKNDMDSWSRKLGHKIAMGRAIKNPLVEVELDSPPAMDGYSPNHARAFYGYAMVYQKVHEMIAQHSSPPIILKVINNQGVKKGRNNQPRKK